MPLTFRFQEIPSHSFGRIYRPVAVVEFEHKTDAFWLPIRMIVDTGADFSILPRSFALPLGVDLADCELQQTQGIGGNANLFLYRGQMARMGKYTRKIPIGFLDQEAGPALLGRHEFFETFRVIFAERQVKFIHPRQRKHDAL
ncbi:MAG: retropepsin-like domain-containing protein [Chloroflexi bacterium]|nr:retropepsin-like domain-containing protein [Chloroflexota bacterium]